MNLTMGYFYRLRGLERRNSGEYYGWKKGGREEERGEGSIMNSEQYPVHTRVETGIAKHVLTSLANQYTQFSGC